MRFDGYYGLKESWSGARWLQPASLMNAVGQTNFSMGLERAVTEWIIRHPQDHGHDK